MEKGRPASNIRDYKAPVFTGSFRKRNVPISSLRNSCFGGQAGADLTLLRFASLRRTGRE